MIKSVHLFKNEAITILLETNNETIFTTKST